MSDKEIIKELARDIGRVYTEFGFPETTGQVWVILHFTGPMTQSELKKELDCGIGSISQSLKVLEKIGAIKIIGKKGRQRVYGVEDSIRKVTKKKIDMALNNILFPINQALENSIKKVKNKDTKEKMNKLKSKFSKMEKLVKIIQSVT